MHFWVCYNFAQQDRPPVWVYGLVRVNSRVLKREMKKKSCHVGVLEVVASMATWQMERVTSIGSRCVLN